MPVAARQPNVEERFPHTIPFSPAGEQLYATVYAFKPAGTARDDDDDEEDTKKKKLGGLTRYRKREGVFLFATAKLKERCRKISFDATP